MLCRNCKQKLKDVPQGFDAPMFTPTQLYCENRECDEFGYVVIVGIPEEKVEHNNEPVKKE